MENKLMDLILKYKQGDKDNILEIINDFMPLLKKYSRKLSYDGADSDLIIALIKIVEAYPIYKNNKASKECVIVSYIATSIRHEYIRLSKKNYKITINEMELNDNIYLIQNNNNNGSMLFVNELLDKLPIKQKRLLRYLFVNEFTEAELALKFAVSRQYINKVKRKALSSLKQYV
ncbi:sigma-70 family RNA polymerase sigma factor [Clostridium sp.]|uniref:sigma-70 family RNA polymerase sigma factor n=1 Tax=Clostridium sp. TaxID=1506 RepID=UPI003D6CE48A